MMCQQFSHLFSLSSTNPIQTAQPTASLLNCIKKTDGSMKNGWLQLWSRAGWCFLKRVKARRWRGNPQQTEKEIVAKTMSTILFIFSDADKWILQPPPTQAKERQYIPAEDMGDYEEYRKK